MPDKPLRFAPLVRVSTESQEKKGESLRTQKADIERAVKALGGVLIPDPWRYSGQEHATPDFEHKRFDQLLKDAPRKIFDAVMVWDVSRWSRDNVRSKQGIGILKNDEIKFFILQTEQDLSNPAVRLYLGLATEVNEYVSAESARKSILNKIARAKRNIPSSGNLPWGRSFDKKTETWRVDPEKQKKIVEAAEQFLKGGSREKIAQMMGLNHVTLWRIFQRCGTTWDIRFRSKALKIDETITLTIPPLLRAEVIKKIEERVEGNKTYGHGPIKHQYLLARMVFCKKCGYTMFGQTNRAGTRYYRHVKGKERGCDMSLWCRADELEETVLIRLFATIGDKEGMEKAMLRAIPDRTQVEKLKKRKEFLQRELFKAEGERRNLVKAVAKGLLSDEDIKSQREEIEKKKISLATELEGIKGQLNEMPTEEVVRQNAMMIQRIISQIYQSPSRLKKMDFEEKRKMASMFFGGMDRQGKRLGVYLEREGKAEVVRYDIRGSFDQTFQGKITPGGLDFLDFKDVPMEHLEDLQEAIRPGGGEQNSKSSKSWPAKGSPHHEDLVKQDCHGEDRSNEPQVEQ